VRSSLVLDLALPGSPVWYYDKGYFRAFVKRSYLETCHDFRIPFISSNIGYVLCWDAMVRVEIFNPMAVPDPELDFLGMIDKGLLAVLASGDKDRRFTEYSFGSPGLGNRQAIVAVFASNKLDMLQSDYWLKMIETLGQRSDTVEACAQRVRHDKIMSLMKMSDGGRDRVIHALDSHGWEVYPAFQSMNDGVPHAHALELSKHVNDSKVDLLSAACVDAIRVSEGRDD